VQPHRTAPVIFASEASLLRRELRRKQIGDGILDKIVMVALGAVERTGDDLFFVLFCYRQLEFALADRAAKDIHQSSFHGEIIT